jgi:hypothetical protein
VKIALPAVQTLMGWRVSHLTSICAEGSVRHVRFALIPVSGLVVMGGLLAIAGTSAKAQQTANGRAGPFDWSGQLAAGSRVRIVDVHGDIRVAAAPGDRVTVHADVRRSGRRRGDIVFDMVRDGDNITICARWADGPPCTGRGLRDQDDREGGESASADFTVQLPRALRLDAETGNGVVDVAGTGTDVRASSGNGVVRVAGASAAVDASSGNGDVTVDGAGGPVTASTGNGAVRAYTAIGPVKASTGNGDVDVRMQTLPTHGPMEFTTGNGRVTIALPASLAATLDADTGHGRIESDFSITVDGRFDPSHLRGAINGGGPRIRLSSGNGDLVLRKI